MRFSSRLAIALIALLYTSTIARADEAGPGPASENPEALEGARKAFEEGIALAAQERWFDAASAFRKSRQHMERPSTLFNLASVLFRLGAFVEAERALRDYFAIAPADDKQHAEAARLQGLVRESIVQLELLVAPPDARVHVDANEAAGSGATRNLMLDPGSHVVTVSRDGYHERVQRVQAQAGQVMRLDVRLEAVAATPIAAPAAALAPLPAPREHDDDDGFFEQPIVWIIGGAVIAAAAVTTAVLVASSGDETPEKAFRGSSDMVLVAR